MGLEYVSSDSSSLMTAMENNINQVKTSMDSLATGAQQLVTAVDGRSLSGAAYTAASGLFSNCILPAIQKTKSAVDGIQTDLNSYKAQDETVSGEGVLDEDELNNQLKSLKESQAAVNSVGCLSTQILQLQSQQQAGVPTLGVAASGSAVGAAIGTALFPDFGTAIGFMVGAGISFVMNNANFSKKSVKKVGAVIGKVGKAISGIGKMFGIGG